jgi:hypothetical protein
MAPAQCNLRNRRQHKRPLRNAGMREHRRRPLSDCTIIIDYVEVERPRPPSFARDTPGKRLYLLKMFEQSLRRHPGFYSGNRVDEIGLIGFA